MENNLSQILSKASSSPSGRQIATKAGTNSLSCDSFQTSWRSDVRAFIRNFVAKPQKNFSNKQEFGVLGSSSKLKKPTNFVHGPVPLCSTTKKGTTFAKERE